MKSKKNVLFVSYSMWDGRWTEKLISQLCSKIDKNYNVFILSLYDISPYQDYIGKYDFIHSWANFFLNSKIYRWFKIRKFCKQSHIDIVVGTSDEINIDIYLSTIFLRIKKIWWVHSNPELHLKSIFKKIVIKNIYPYFDRIVCVSKGIEYSLHEDFWIRNTKVILNYLDMTVEKNIIEKSNQWEVEISLGKKWSPTILTISRLDMRKWLLKSIEAFSVYNKKYPTSKYIILWEWPDREQLEKYIKSQGLDTSVFLLGHKNNIYSYMIYADIFLLTSYSEAFWLVLLEAGVTKTPIISSDTNFWPREILTNIWYETKLNYPFIWGSGILICSPGREDFVKNFIEALELENKPTFMWIDKFDINRAVNQWEEVL